MAGEMAVIVGRNMRAAREAKHWNQRQLATEIAKRDTSLKDPGEAAVSNTAVSEWERAVRTPGNRYMPLIAEALDQDVAWFYVDHNRKTQPAPDPFPQEERSQFDRIEAALAEINERLTRLEARPSDATAIQAALEDYMSRLGREVGKRPPRSRRTTDPPSEAPPAAA